MSVVEYTPSGPVVRLTLNRPEALNAIDMDMPRLLREGVERANADPEVRVIVVQGAGRAFCAGYDLRIFAEAPGPNPGFQEMPWDPMADYRMMMANTQAFMSLWHSPKPTIARVHGYAVGGGSDIALCCDLVVMEETARIGYPPARVWGCPTTAMWVYRVGAEQAKRLLLTGDLVEGWQARAMGLVAESVRPEMLDVTVDSLAERMARVPLNQLMMHKMLVNQAVESMGLAQSQRLATLFDGIARHTPEGVAFKRRCEEVGFKQAVAERDAPPA